MNPENKNAQQSSKILKIIIIGDSEVGKTALITRFIENTFQKKYLPTIGVDFRLKKVSFNQEEFNLQIWDTAGQERFRTITRNFFRGANGIVICFDLTNSNSLIQAKEWLRFSNQEYESGTISKVLVGTKADLIIDLDNTILEKYIIDYKIQYFMTSSKSGLNVEEAFDYLVNQIRINLNQINGSRFLSHGKTDEEEQKEYHERKVILRGRNENQISCRC